MPRSAWMRESGRSGLANEYLKLGQLEQAIGHLRKALADTGRTDEARAAYESGIKAAEEKGDVQAAKEMRVFLKRLQK